MAQMNYWWITMETESGLQKRFAMETMFGKDAAVAEFQRQQKCLDKNGCSLMPAGKIISIEPRKSSDPPPPVFQE